MEKGFLALLPRHLTWIMISLWVLSRVIQMFWKTINMAVAQSGWFSPTSYLTQWYLTQLLNAGWERSIDIAGLAKSYPDIKRDLKMFGNNCFDDMNFTPTQEMKNIISFMAVRRTLSLEFKLEEAESYAV